MQHRSLLNDLMHLCAALAVGLAAGLTGLTAGCTTIGPTTILRDRFDYASAISDSWKNQMLLNLVKVRYADVPVFLDISSAISSYSMESSASGTFTLPIPLGDNSRTLELGGAGRFTDRPTISYNPLLGDKFSKSLMTPLPPGALLSLIQAGWGSELLLRCCVHSVNGRRNFSQRAFTGHPADHEFSQMIALMSRIQQGGGIGLRMSQERGATSAVLFFPAKRSAAVLADVNELKQLLGMVEQRLEYPVVFGAEARSDQEVAILTRSMLEILIDMSSYIDVPAIHLAERRAGPGYPEAEAVAGVKPLLRVRSSVHKPEDPFVVIRYRDYWFWIDDRDLPSKGVFTFLMFLFSLTETGGGQVAPIITVPAN